jgi:hypothetical protein
MDIFKRNPASFHWLDAFWHLSKDWNPSVTERVITIMLAEEY